jgi:hypothetical protein
VGYDVIGNRAWVAVCGVTCLLARDVAAQCWSPGHPDVRLRWYVACSERRVAVLARATYGGRPGHPVLIGRDHLPSIVAGLGGDTGAKDYLAQHDADGVECGDLASGQDRDSA